MTTPPVAHGPAWKAWSGVVLCSLGLLALLNVPYLFAYAVPEPHFLGILLNLQDGHSYLAKMRLGWEGAWLFTLSFTPEPGPGVFLFTYYLALGHLARGLGWSLETVYHLARNLNGMFFLLSAYAFLGHFFVSARQRFLAWSIFVLGSGLGWLAAMVGWFTADMWVAEWVPLLTLLTNAHFALAAALQLWIIAWALLPNAGGGLRIVGTGLATVGLALVFPQTVLAVLVVVVTVVGWRLVQTRQFTWATTWPLWVIGGAGAPFIINAAYLSLAHPAIRVWSEQSVTLSPPLWELAVASGVPLALAGAGLGWGARQRPLLPVLVVVGWWWVAGTAAIYLPFFAQRRLMIGLWMPVSIGAVYGWREVVAPRLARRWRNLVLAGLLVATVMSNTLVYLATLAAVVAHKDEFFLSGNEDQAIHWLEAHAPHQLVVASLAVSRVLPGRAGVRVFYGHTMETVNAEAATAAVEAFFATGQSLTPAPSFMFYGPREQALGTPDWAGWQLCANFETVKIYGRTCP